MPVITRFSIIDITGLDSVFINVTTNGIRIIAAITMAGDYRPLGLLDYYIFLSCQDTASILREPSSFLRPLPKDNRRCELNSCGRV